MLPLSGIAVLVTRPLLQAGRLISGIERLGGHAVAYPVIEIADILDDAKLKSIMGRLSEYDLAIFVSANAVEKAMEKIRIWPDGLKCAAVGRATLAALQSRGIDDVILPEHRFDSEGLLESPELEAVEGKKIVIFRGEGGRERLAEELKKRGAKVDYAECYRRIVPDARFQHEEAEIQALTATSGESVRNLCEMAKDCGWIFGKPIFVTHERIGEVARNAGFSRVMVTEMGDEGLLEGLVKWFEVGEGGHG